MRLVVYYKAPRPNLFILNLPAFEKINTGFMTVFVEMVRMAKSKQSMNQSERSDLPQGYLAIQQLLIIRFQVGSDKKIP